MFQEAFWNTFSIFIIISSLNNLKSFSKVEQGCPIPKFERQGTIKDDDVRFTFADEDIAQSQRKHVIIIRRYEMCKCSS